ncbi:MAG: heavy-metal-associated domain-containing protein [Thaumarchaeota archaeon]|nr:MAG: heavy-metal-associated domain-containing protein [Nitrososphaerota archaeon]
MSRCFPVTETKRTTVKIGGMHCAGCVNSIQGRVSNQQGSLALMRWTSPKLR